MVLGLGVQNVQYDLTEEPESEIITWILPRLALLCTAVYSGVSISCGFLTH